MEAPARGVFPRRASVTDTEMLDWLEAQKAI
jgi:hypothetical protein